jgi:CheY-like chemotaxis protein
MVTGSGPQFFGQNETKRLSMFVMVLCDELMFSSRITGTARALGLTVQLVRAQQDLANWLLTQKPDCIIVDLHNSSLSIEPLMQQIPSPRPYLVGFGSHVDTATLQAARAAGFDLVLPRSKFADDLEAALPQWCAARPASIQ